MKVLTLILLVTPTLAMADKASGFLFGEKEITIKAKSQGEITTMNHEEGSRISQNDVIAVIDDRQEVTERDLASVELKTAQQDYQKTRKLKKYVSQEEIIQKKNAFLQKKSVFELKQYNLTNTRVISPINGIITQSYFDKGETVSVGDKVFEVVALENLYMEVHVPSRDVGKFNRGQRVKFSTELHKNKKFEAEVTYVSPVIDAASGTVKVRLAVQNTLLPNDRYELRPGTMTTIEY